MQTDSIKFTGKKSSLLLYFVYRKYNFLFILSWLFKTGTKICTEFIIIDTKGKFILCLKSTFPWKYRRKMILCNSYHGYIKEMKLKSTHNFYFIIYKWKSVFLKVFKSNTKTKPHTSKKIASKELILHTLNKCSLSLRPNCKKSHNKSHNTAAIERRGHLRKLFAGLWQEKIFLVRVRRYFFTSNRFEILCMVNSNFSTKKIMVFKHKYVYGLKTYFFVPLFK